MNNKPKMFSDWSEVTSGERNQLVFERLNKTYGAFEIRNNYEKTLLKVFSGIGFLIFLLSTGLILWGSGPAIKIIIPNSDPITFYHTKNQEVILVPKTIEPPRIRVIQKIMRVVVPVITTEPKEVNPKNIIATSQIIDQYGTGVPCDTCNDEPPVISGTSTPTAPIIEKVLEIGDLDVLPHFPGGDTELYRYLRNNVHIPESISEINGGINEKIGVVFIIDRDGSITSESILKGGSKYAELNKEAIRVINKMPNWEPGKQNGNKVKVRMILPFRFEVKN